MLELLFLYLTKHQVIIHDNYSTPRDTGYTQPGNISHFWGFQPVMREVQWVYLSTYQHFYHVLFDFLYFCKENSRVYCMCVCDYFLFCVASGCNGVLCKV